MSRLHAAAFGGGRESIIHTPSGREQRRYASICAEIQTSRMQGFDYLVD